MDCLDNEKIRRHQQQIMTRIYEHLKNNQLCDVILKVDGVCISAHRLILSAASEYFRAMFNGNVKEATQDEITLKNIDPTALKDLISYIYTGKLEMNEDSIETLLTTANMLHLDQVVDEGCSFLKKQLHPTNCIGICNFADQQSCKQLKETARQFILKNFLEVVKHREFLQLSVEQLIDLISHDHINVESELDVVVAMFTWIKHKEGERSAALSRLFTHIRLPYLPKEFLTDELQTHPYVKQNMFCIQLIIKAFSHYLFPDRKMLISPRKSTSGSLYAVGGMDSSKGATSVERYDPRLDEWKHVTQMTTRRQQFGVAVLDGKIYIVGGRDGLKTLNSVECFDPKTSHWTVMPPIAITRHGLGVAVLKGPMYAVGGHDGWSFLNTVERYDPQARCWSYVAPMSVARSTVGVAVIDEKLYAVGGRDGSSCLRSVECFNPHFNKWTPCAPMSKRRGCVGVGQINGYLYAVGGHDAPASNQISKLTDTVERYDPRCDQWTTLTPLKCPRDAVGVCVLGNLLYACGGYDGHSYLSNCEAYDPHASSWKQVAPFNTPRGGTVVVRIDNHR